MIMEVFKSFLIIIVVVLSFGVTVVAGQNGLLSARCAARCLTEHKDMLRGGKDRNSHRKFMIDHCKNNAKCFECMKPCVMSDSKNVQHNCIKENCLENESECENSCEFLYYTSTYKAGDCPRPETAIGFEAVCLASCRVDGDCGEHTKCCPNLCGYVCRTPDYTNHNLPEVPSNFTCEERRQGRALKLSWILPSVNRKVPGIVLYVLEHRNTTSLKPVWNDNTPWKTAFMTLSKQILLRKIHAGHWYQYRVAAVTSSGTQGYSSPSPPFKSSRRVQRPMPPQNITEGVTTLRKGHVDLTIHWEPPKYSDLPVWKYMITWVKRLSTISPVLLKIPLFEKSVQGHIHEFKLRKLEPGTTYNIKIEAIVQYGNRQLRSSKTSKDITTYTPPNAKPDNQEQVYSVYAEIIRVEKLEVVDGRPYFDRGSLKARLKWKVGADFQSIVKSFMIFWTPYSCDQDFAILEPYSATSDVPVFEVYDLQFECKYNINVSAVTKSGVQGKPTTVKLVTPICEKIIVKGNSLPPECPERVPKVPGSPRKVQPVTIKNNCSIDISITWKHPKSDLPIDSYLVTYRQSDDFKEVKVNTDGLVYKQKPFEIRLGKVTSVLVPGLKPSEVYLIHVHAVSAAGVGEPAIIEILTPLILPCGSDKDPEPPDRSQQKKTTARPSTVFIVTQGSDVIREVTEAVTKATTTKYRNSIYRKNPQYDSNTEKVNLDIYKTFYYLSIFIYKLLNSS
ncbi:anosmin-1-like isoform X2 [Mercenaria mercenaria]|uniref:anosmin-1-like isoform X2 n=1 Tax=Mercenaria mercenaria TaxID=6596 RepID=UPI00234F68FE|nr:anosmin-1-like isoform X2 [Mercenaria mercenaria]